MSGRCARVVAALQLADHCRQWQAAGAQQYQQVIEQIG
jgi:hypothetical protein